MNYSARSEEKHLSYLATYDEIVNNSYNLSVSTYVELEDRREKVDINKLNSDIDDIVRREEGLRNAIKNIIKKIEG